MCLNSTKFSGGVWQRKSMYQKLKTLTKACFFDIMLTKYYTYLQKRKTWYFTKTNKSYINIKMVYYISFYKVGVLVYLIIKRIIDIVLSLLGLIFLLPIFLIIVVAIKIDSKGPVFFKQKRVGIHKTYFNILKFRTMRIDAPKDMPTHLLENPEQYITRLGKFLRKTSLDELPQILNILIGDMRGGDWKEINLEILTA
jgi:lipopolysaccharide/colanic/teichoic acid biosynthesis glycosyltransferase